MRLLGWRLAVLMFKIFMPSHSYSQPCNGWMGTDGYWSSHCGHSNNWKSKLTFSLDRVDLSQASGACCTASCNFCLRSASLPCGQPCSLVGVDMADENSSRGLWMGHLTTLLWFNPASNLKRGEKLPQFTTKISGIGKHLSG